MVQRFLETLCSELSIAMIPERNEKHFFLLQFAPDVVVSLLDLDPGVAMHAIVGACPVWKREESFIYFMRANLLGQGVGDSVLGMDSDEKNLTLSQSLPYEINYQRFKEAFEEFANHLIYWRNELIHLQQEVQ